MVYLGLLDRRLTTAGILAKHTGLKRSTVYTALDSLIEKGLVSVTQKDSVKHYQAESPDRIQDFLHLKKEAVEKEEKNFLEIREDLKILHHRHLNTPRVTIYEGRKGVDTLLMKNLDDHPKKVFVIGQYLKDEDHIPRYTKRRIAMKISTGVIVPDSPFARECRRKDKQETRKTYFVSNSHRFPASIHIYDRSVSIFTYSEQDPVGVYIENQDIATTLRMTFQLLEKSLSKKA